MATGVTARHSRSGGAPASELDELRDVVRRADWTAATRLLASLEERYPLDPEVWYWRATLAKTDTEAAGHLEQVLQADPANTKALKALALMRLGASSRAVPALKTPEGPGPCPVCAHASRVGSSSCGGCGCITDATRLQEILNNFDLDRSITAAAVERRISQGTADSLFGAALGCLNLGQWAEAEDLAARACAADPLHASAPALTQRLRSNRGWILAAVEGPVIRTAVMRAMDKAGYAVRIVTLARDAVEHAGPPTRLAVVGDLGGVTGRELCRRIRAVAGPLPLILVGGGWMDRVLPHGSGADERLPANFDAATLAAAALPHLESAAP